MNKEQQAEFNRHLTHMMKRRDKAADSNEFYYWLGMAAGMKAAKEIFNPEKEIQK